MSIFLIFFIIIEVILILVIKLLKFKKIAWIITKEDEFPIFSEEKRKKFLERTFDKNLGWNWKPNSIHKEIINSKKNKIFFGKYAERKNDEFKEYNYSNQFASFGDSFVFCRYSKNKDTWQSQLSKLGSYNGLNFGVGNYGLDQIYLKYKKTKIPKNIKTIYIGFVPETLSRCLCSWKHYHEFNNIYAFKPKYRFYKNSFELLNNPIKNENSFLEINKIIRNLRENEFFYNNKFLKYQLTFPYFFSILKNLNYNFKLFFFSFLKILKIDSDKIYDFIIEKNCIKNDFYFMKDSNIKLITHLMHLFKKQSMKKKHKIIFLVFPQKFDLKLKNPNYKKQISRLKKKYKIIDFTDIFNKYKISKIYLPGKYGGHLTRYGNKLVAQTILKKRDYKW
jgi:hypothetical protein